MGRKKNTASFWTRIPSCGIQNADIPIQMASSHFLGIQNTSSQTSEHFTFIKATKLTEGGLEITQGR